MQCLTNNVFLGNTTLIDQFNLKNLMPDDMDMFFRNNGSLTTPTCDQSVTWTVFKKTLGVSLNQVSLLSLLLYHGIVKIW